MFYLYYLPNSPKLRYVLIEDSLYIFLPIALFYAQLKLDY